MAETPVIRASNAHADLTNAFPDTSPVKDNDTLTKAFEKTIWNHGGQALATLPVTLVIPLDDSLGGQTAFNFHVGRFQATGADDEDAFIILLHNQANGIPSFLESSSAEGMVKEWLDLILPKFLETSEDITSNLGRTPSRSVN